MGLSGPFITFSKSKSRKGVAVVVVLCRSETTAALLKDSRSWAALDDNPMEPRSKRLRKDIPPSEVVQDEDKELEIQVVGVSGDGFQVRVPKSLTGSEFRRIIRDRLPLKAGARVAVMKGSQKLSLSKTLAQEGLVQGEPTSLSYAYEAACLQEAWRCIQKCPVDDESMALEGIRQLNWPSTLQCLVVWGPRSEVVNMDLPWGLQRFECKFQEEEERQPWVISTGDKKHGCQ